jgi:hypothetical protein
MRGTGVAGQWVSRRTGLTWLLALLLVLIVVGTARLVSGRPMLRIPGRWTDATYLSRGRQVMPPGWDGRWPGPWAWRPGWQRQAVRLSVLGAAGGWMWVWFAHPRAAVVWAWVAGAVGVVGAARRVARAVREWHWHRVFDRPLAAALGPVLGTDPDRPGTWLHIDPTLGALSARVERSMRPAEVRIRTWWGTRVHPVVSWVPDRVQRVRWWVSGLGPVASVVGALSRPVEGRPVCVEVRTRSPYVSEESRTRAGEVLRAKLGATGLVPRWSQVGPVTSCQWTVQRTPPDRAALEDVRAALAARGPAEIVLGVATGGTPHVVSLDDDAPHIGMSAGSGAGKSVFAMLVAVQVLGSGGRVWILDRKGSHRWARGLPGVTYCMRPEDMHSALVGLAQEADRRNTQAMEEDDGWEPPDRVLVILEEWNAGVALLKTWWQEHRESSDPKTSPAVSAYQDLMFMGRSAHINIMVVAQMFTAQLGGAAARENAGIRLMARYTQNNLKMMAPQVGSIPPSRVRGRWLVIVGSETTQVQVPLLTSGEARALVLDARERGMSHVPSDGTQGAQPGVLPGGDSKWDTGWDTAPTGPVGGPEGLGLTLREWCDRGVVPWAYDAARKRRSRAIAAGSWALPETGRYSRAQIDTWITRESREV